VPLTHDLPAGQPHERMPPQPSGNMPQVPFVGQAVGWHVHMPFTQVLLVPLQAQVTIPPQPLSSMPQRPSPHCTVTH
jgi:hypothetical protein